MPDYQLPDGRIVPFSGSFRIIPDTSGKPVIDLIGGMTAGSLDGVVDVSDLALISGLTAGSYTIPMLAIDPGVSDALLYATAGGAIDGITLGAANTVFVSHGAGITPSFSLIANANIDAAANIAWSKLDSASATEGVQDIVGALLQDSSNFDFTYDDTGAIESLALIGTIADARLSANVPLLNASNIFTANQQVKKAEAQLWLGQDTAAGQDVFMRATAWEQGFQFTVNANLTAGANPDVAANYTYTVDAGSFSTTAAAFGYRANLARWEWAILGVSTGRGNAATSYTSLMRLHTSGLTVLTAGSFSGLITANQATANAELLKFAIERTWSFFQRSTGATTYLALASNTDGKDFVIQASNGSGTYSDQFKFTTSSTGGSNAFDIINGTFKMGGTIIVTAGRVVQNVSGSIALWNSGNMAYAQLPGTAAGNWITAGVSLAASGYTGQNLGGSVRALTIALNGSSFPVVQLHSNSDSLADLAVIPGYQFWYGLTTPTKVAEIGTVVRGTAENAADLVFYTANAGTLTERMRVGSKGNIVHGTAALATNATDGFLYIPTCAGTPTGVPTAFTGQVPLIYDTTNNKLYAYNGGWKTTTVFA